MPYGNGQTQWNSTLRRSAPLRNKKKTLGGFKTPDAKKALSRQREIKKRSAKAEARHREYIPIQNAVVAEWRDRGERCAVCIARGIANPNFATEVHHIRGRRGSLLTDIRGFIPSCFFCRTWPHDNQNAARAAGVLSERKLWEIPFDENNSK